MARLLEHSMSAVALAVLFLLGGASSSSAKDERCLARAGQWPTGESKAVAVSEGHVYYAKGLALMVAAIDAPDFLEIVGELRLPNLILDVAVSGDHAYVATWGAGLRIVDVSTPSEPVEVGVVETYEELNALDVSGDLLVVATRIEGIVAYDVSTPSSPVEVFSYGDYSRFYDVVMTEYYVYAVDCFGSFLVFGRSDPSVLRLLGLADVEYCPGSIAVADGTAFVGTFSDGFRVFDVSSPSNPREIGILSTLERIHDIDTIGKTAIVATSYGVYSVDTSDPTAPVELGFFGTDSVSWAVTVADRDAYVGIGGGLEVIDVEDPENLDGITGLFQPVDIRGMAAVESLIFAADGYHGLWVVDVSVPQFPNVIGFAEKQGQYPLAVVLDGNHAFVADNTGLQIFNVADPSNPFTVGSFETPGFAFDVAVSSQFAFVADYEDPAGVRVVDVSDPSLPVEVGILATGSRTRRVVAVDDMLYVGDDQNGLIVVDVSDPTAPTERSRVPLDGIRVEDLDVVNGIAFVAQYRHAVQFVDVSNPDAPVDIGTFDWAYWPTGVAVVGDALYLTDYDEGMRVIDISLLSAPVEVEFFETPGDANAVEALGNRVYASDISLGVRNFIRCPRRQEPYESVDRPE